MTAFTSESQEVVETIYDATHEDFNDAVERYHEKEGYYQVVNLVRVTGEVRVTRLHPVDEDEVAE